jgi:SAM-dependent methyltransferase
MSHPRLHDFIRKVKQNNPQYFRNVRVLDFGSLDINGCSKFHFENSDYTGVDIGAGANVDVVALAHEYDSRRQFDVVLTTELFEHDVFWRQTFLNGFRLLKSGGIYIFTCAGYGRPEHGTKRADGDSSPFTSKLFAWDNYYENRTIKDFVNLLDFEKEFKRYSFEYAGDVALADLYFYGIKR